MVMSRLTSLRPFQNFINKSNVANNLITVRSIRKTKEGLILPEPERTSFGILRIFVTVISGLLIGAAISKNIANFLEENDLFVPSDDDDDDD